MVYYQAAASLTPKLYVEVVGGINWHITSATQYLINIVKEHMDCFEGIADGVKYVKALIPPERAAYTSSTPQVLTCGLVATSAYMKHNLGMETDNHDEYWYKTHPLCVASGLPQQHTLSVIHHLVNPYGLGISKVFHRRGVSMSPDAIKWMTYLPPNPMGYGNRTTSNKEYAELCGFDPKVVESEYSTEFVDKPKGPVILFNAVAATTSFASGGGHASYAGPRAKFHSWEMAIRLDRLERINYAVEPEIVEVEPKLNQVLDVWKCLTKDGATLESKKPQGTTFVVPPMQKSLLPLLPSNNSLIISKGEFEDFKRYNPNRITDDDYKEVLKHPVNKERVESFLSMLMNEVDKLGETSDILVAAGGVKLKDLSQKIGAVQCITDLKNKLCAIAKGVTELTLSDIIYFNRQLVEDKTYDIIWALGDEMLDNMLDEWILNLYGVNDYTK